jgi:hypothetical protein
MFARFLPSRRLACVATLSTATLAAVILGASCVAAADRSLGTFKDWSAMAFGDTGDLTCMAFTQPVKSEGNYTKRGDAFVFITHRPAAGQRGRISVEAGYTYDTSVPVTITVDGRSFELRADGSAAWLSDPSQGAALVEAMRAGRVMRVEGTSSRGTRTVDEYSLLGFSAATRAIDDTCR